MTSLSRYMHRWFHGHASAESERAGYVFASMRGIGMRRVLSGMEVALLHLPRSAMNDNVRKG